MTTKLNLRPATRKETFYSGRIGTIHASFEELKAVFGEPHDCRLPGEWESGDGKIRIEWAFVINQNKKMVFTIYDYKESMPLEEVREWSLGGKDAKIKVLLGMILDIE